MYLYIYNFRANYKCSLNRHIGTYLQICHCFRFSSDSAVFLLDPSSPVSFSRVVGSHPEGLVSQQERHFEIPPSEVLESYFGEYSAFAKAYRTQLAPNHFFRDITKFLLEVACAHLNSYEMLKHKAGVIVTTYEGKLVNWGIVTRATLAEGVQVCK